MKKLVLAMFFLPFCAEAQNLVFEGDSNVSGEFIEPSGHWTGDDRNYPNQTSWKVTGYQEKNIGRGGATTTTVIDDMQSRFPPIINSSSVFCLTIGWNDIANVGADYRPSAVINRIGVIIRYVRSLACTRIVVTTNPTREWNEANADWLTLNELIRDSAIDFGYVVADVAANARLAVWSEPDTSNANECYWADWAHWGVAGCAIVADSVAAKIQSLASLPIREKAVVKKETKTVSVYPNPSTGMVHITGNREVTVTDMADGGLLFKGYAKELNLAKGIYTIKVGDIVFKQIIVP